MPPLKKKSKIETLTKQRNKAYIDKNYKLAKKTQKEIDYLDYGICYLE